MQAEIVRGWLTYKEAEQLVGLSRTTLWKLISAGEIEHRKGKGRERLLSEHNVSERQLDLALSYHEAYPGEIDEALEENARPPEEWHEISPSVIPSPSVHS